MVKPLSPDPSRALVLASTSRYRRALLGQLGLPFIVAAPGTDETPLPGEAPMATALRLAVAKARSVAPLHPDALIIGSDQAFPKSPGSACPKSHTPRRPPS